MNNNFNLYFDFKGFLVFIIVACVNFPAIIAISDNSPEHSRISINHGYMSSGESTTFHPCQ